MPVAKLAEEGAFAENSPPGLLEGSGMSLTYVMSPSGRCREQKKFTVRRVWGNGATSAQGEPFCKNWTLWAQYKTAAAAGQDFAFNAYRLERGVCEQLLRADGTHQADEAAATAKGERDAIQLDVPGHAHGVGAV